MTALEFAAGLGVVAGLMLAGFGRLCRWSQASLAPRDRARCMMAGLAVAVAVIYSGLALLATPAMLELLPGRALANWPLLASGAGPGGEAASWLATCLMLVSGCTVAVSARRCRRERLVLRVERDIGMHERRTDFDVVTVPGAGLVAYSISGRRPQIVLSDGLRGKLGDEGLAAVVAHESAHLRARHGRWLYLMSLTEAALWFAPWVSPSADAIRLSLERWADEDAAGQVGRQALRTALLTAADMDPVPSPAAALSGTDALTERLARLGAPPLATRLCLAGASSLALMAVLAIVGTGGLGAALAVLHHLCGS
jgi:Zn-dependent protease with chaperone function